MSLQNNEVFGEPFELIELTNSINRIPYKEEALGMMFDWNVVRSQTEKVRINSAGGRIQVVPSTPRDGVAPVRAGDKRQATFVEIPGYAERATIMNREVLNVGAGLDGEDKLMAVETLRDERLAEINGDLDVTVEHQRAKALTGLIEDVDGVELADMYQVMGVEQITVDLDFGDTAKDFAIQLEEHKEIAEIAMGGSSGDIDHFKLICGKDVSKKASASKGYREAMSDPLARILSKQDGRKGVVVNDNVEIVHYRRGFLAPDACFLVPVYPVAPEFNRVLLTAAIPATTQAQAASAGADAQEAGEFGQGGQGHSVTTATAATGGKGGRGGGGGGGACGTATGTIAGDGGDGYVAIFFYGYKA